MMYGLLFHDLSHFLHHMEIECKALQRYWDNKEMSRSYVKEMLKCMENNVDEAMKMLKFYILIDKIRVSQLKINYKIPILLYDRLIDKARFVDSRGGKYNGLFLDIVSDQPELLHKELYVNNDYLIALDCIFDNAIKYASLGSVICINVYSNELVISNVGIPIQEDEQIHMYDFEYRGRAAKWMNRGMGYGLYVAKNVFDAYESKISITSESIYERNGEVESLISGLIETLPKDETNSIAWEKLTAAEYDAARNAIKKICEIYDMSNNSESHHVSNFSIKNWLNFWNRVLFQRSEEEGVSDNSFKPIAKVTVTITYGKEKENSNNR